ncbi:flagellar basal body rod protein FlgB [Falsiroseomonas oryziterrae]|uniref:flagellar basal body rod protein FlgB n=1 Tax=Falsiroseomonas oryziterrae TaxID=2911368 RepID=UPI001EFF820E|nr:flagellar basal body protein [Roseomonas sp. NPKOSM-4]
MDAMHGFGAGAAPTRAAQAAQRHDPLTLAERRLGWLDRRQAVLAQNVANADTPGFRPRDLTPFGRELAGQMRLVLARTQPGHGSGSQAIPQARPDRQAGDVAPDGNAVSLDREAVRIAETDTAHQLAMAVHRSFAGMFRMALGR